MQMHLAALSCSQMSARHLSTHSQMQYQDPPLTFTGLGPEESLLHLYAKSAIPTHPFKLWYAPGTLIHGEV